LLTEESGIREVSSNAYTLGYRARLSNPLWSGKRGNYLGVLVWKKFEGLEDV